MQNREIVVRVIGVHSGKEEDNTTVDLAGKESTFAPRVVYVRNGRRELLKTSMTSQG